MPTARIDTVTPQPAVAPRRIAAARSGVPDAVSDRSQGHNKAVAELGGLKILGFIAWLMWRGLYLLRMPTLARKTRLFLEWNRAMFFPPDISHPGYRRTKRRAPQAANFSEPREPTQVPARIATLQPGEPENPRVT